MNIKEYRSEKIDKTVEYNLNYIKKNISIKKLLLLLNTKAKWHNENENWNFKIIDWAIKSCVNDTNNDPNLSDLNNVYKEQFLVDYCFFPERHMIEEDDGSETKYIPDEDDKLKSDKFIKETKEYEIDGTLLSKISKNFKSTYNFKLNFPSNTDSARIETNTLVYSDIDETYYFIINDTGEFENQVVKIFKNKLTKIEFFEEIIKFKKWRGIDDESYYIDPENGKNYFLMYKNSEL